MLCSSRLGGYACVPYTHDHEAVRTREGWAASGNIDRVYFATATVAPAARPYFAGASNHYLVARYADGAEMAAEMAARRGPGPSFLFGASEYLFEREAGGGARFAAVYALEYGWRRPDAAEVAGILVRQQRVCVAYAGRLSSYSPEPPRFAFPYPDVLFLEVSGAGGHQGASGYCERARTRVARRGIPMSGVVGLSVLERLK